MLKRLALLSVASQAVALVLAASPLVSATAARAAETASNTTAVFVDGDHYINTGKFDARGTAVVYASGNAEGVASENAEVHLTDNAWVKAGGKVVIFAGAHSTAQCDSDDCMIFAKDYATAFAFAHSSVLAVDHAGVHGHDFPTIFAFDDVEVAANDGTTVFANNRVIVDGRESLVQDHGSIEAFDNAVVVTNQGNFHNSERPVVHLYDQAVWTDWQSYGGVQIHRAGQPVR